MALLIGAYKEMPQLVGRMNGKKSLMTLYCLLCLTQKVRQQLESVYILILEKGV